MPLEKLTESVNMLNESGSITPMALRVVRLPVATLMAIGNGLVTS